MNRPPEAFIFRELEEALIARIYEDSRSKMAEAIYTIERLSSHQIMDPAFREALLELRRLAKFTPLENKG